MSITRADADAWVRAERDEVTDAELRKVAACPAVNWGGAIIGRMARELQAHRATNNDDTAAELEALKARRCDGCANGAPNGREILCGRTYMWEAADHACNAWTAKP